MKRWGCPLGKLLLEVTSPNDWGGSRKFMMLMFSISIAQISIWIWSNQPLNTIHIYDLEAAQHHSEIDSTWSQFWGGRKPDCPEKTLEVRLRSTETQFTYYICSRGGRRDWCPLRQIDVHYASLAPQIKLFIKNNQVYLIMQNTSNDIKHRCKLSLCSILIPEYDFCFNLNSN